MTLLLFNGEEILGFMAGAGLGCIGFVSMVLWLSIRPPSQPILPAVVYFLLASVPATIFLSDDGYVLLLGVIVSAPWSILFVAHHVPRRQFRQCSGPARRPVECDPVLLRGWIGTMAVESSATKTLRY